MKRILIAAFDIDPTTGGESGMAWNFVNQVAMKHKVILITQQKHRRSVNAFLTAEAGVSRSNISVLGLDLHPLMHFLHGNALTEYFYYFIWQLRLPSAIVKSKVEFDVVHNLSMDKDWTPSFLYKLRKPFVWGPIGHKPQIPANYLKYVYGSETYLAERIKWIAKKILWRYG